MTVVSQYLEITDTPVTATVGDADLVGRVWRMSPFMPWSGDTTPEADAYRLRNADKTRDAKVWLGIRYAEPPVGPLRWAAPVPYTYPAGTHQCTSLPGVAWQRSPQEGLLDGRPEWGLDRWLWNWTAMGATKTEDCLQLNVYVPDGTPPSGGWPVAVLIHGGAFGLGSPNGYQQRAHRLTTKGVMVISPAYRLADFGFQWSPELDADTDYDGASLALADQRVAIRWAYDNAAAFGGDPENITLAGWSAGGASVLHHLGDPEMQGYFVRGYVSGGGGTDYVTEGYNPDAPALRDGYAQLYERLHRGAVAIADHILDYSDPSRTLADAIAEHGAFEGLRRGLSPDLVMQFTNRRRFIPRAQFVAGSLAFSQRGHQNFYPLRDPDHSPHGGGMKTAIAGGIEKPLWCNVAASEAHGLVGDMAAVNHTGLARRLGFFDYVEWKTQPWAPAGGLWEHGRVLYAHATFVYPAWRIARGMADTDSAPVWLSMWGISGDGQPWASHTSDLGFINGAIEWRVALAGDEARISARLMLAVDAMQQAFANYCASGDPNTHYGYPGDWSLFAAPVAFGLAEYSLADPYTWNIFGTNSEGQTLDAPVQCIQGEWFAGAMAAYFDREAV